MKQLLIVEDDGFLNRMLMYNLTADGDSVDKGFLDEIVQLLGLEDKLKKMPNALSGGQ